MNFLYLLAGLVHFSQGIASLAAQVKLANLLIAYFILSLIIVIGWYRRK